MTGRIHGGFRHELVVTEARWVGHLRAVLWGAIAAAIVVGVGL